MLCPEVSNFPPPKVMTSCTRTETLDPVIESVKMNDFYNSVVITCPDELHTPPVLLELITEDTEFYKISDCPLSLLIDPSFIQNFVKNGKLYCLSAERNCVIQNCAAITPDGILTLHLLEYIYQTIGLEGFKRPLGFYDICIDLKTIKNFDKIRHCLQKLEAFDFYLSWEPNEDTICPSSLAKYFYDRNINVTQHEIEIKHLSPSISEVPSLKDTEENEMTEWIGMLAHNGDLNQKETYISTYAEPESDFAMKTARISLCIAKGFITPTIVNNLCKCVSEYVTRRDLDNYWACVSVQSENSLWRWDNRSCRMFQAHDSSHSIYITKHQVHSFMIGQIKYS